MRTTRTFALLQVSAETYAEIRRLLVNADYGHAFCSDDGREVIDMHGIALLEERHASVEEVSASQRRASEHHAAIEAKRAERADA